MNEELIFNLWAIYDASTGFVYALSGRTYCVSGTDEEKLTILRRLSRTDYITATRYNVPERFHIVNTTDGSVKKGLTYINAVHDNYLDLFEDVFISIEGELPQIPDFSASTPRGIKQKVPDNPLTVRTVLYETQNGDIRPIVTDEDRRWIEEYEQGLLDN